MKESIHIKNFGPIKDVCIDDIRPLTMFIGESAGGKSTIMKVLTLFRWIFKMCNLREYHIKSGGKDIRKFELTDEHLSYSGLLKLCSETTFVVYKVRQSDNSCFTLRLIGKLLEIDGELSDKDFVYEKLIYLTETRGFISNLLGSAAKRPHFENLFEETLEHFEKACSAQLSNVNNNVSPNIDFLGIRFSMRKNKHGMVEHFIESEGTTYNSSGGQYTIPYGLASSGIQNTVPILLILRYYSSFFDLKSALNESVLNSLKDFGLDASDFKPVSKLTEFSKGIHVHIEEPELGLFPDAQCDLFNSLVNEAFGNRANRVSLTMTTHSPYILNHLNLLIKAHDTDDTQFTDGAKINFNDVAAYQVEDGGIESLKREELGQKFIDTNALSDTINDTYNRYQELDK